MNKPKLEDFYDVDDPRGCSSSEYNQYLLALEEFENQEITLEDELEMWKQIEKNYLVESKENVIIKSDFVEGEIQNFYPIYIQSDNYKKLLVFQQLPESKIFFKDKEINITELVKILEKC